ncbi:hypothetical protein B4915_12000 [Leucobacter massiliensis]|uniref:Carbohydrate kinase PfkB domain-containing protein n=1 Tax=Leucobacter massiliensis TaxID=1686285 RepID=A0A2S9QLD9_9MICO|nr:hypothetical protein B4915_12000 [Leucobacter massiliensis]
MLTLGETMGLITSAESGRLRAGAPMRLSFGGAESNVAIGLARLGHPVRWLSRLGEDAIGEAILAGLRGEGVECAVARDPRRPSGLMLKHSPRPGASSVSYRRAGSAATALGPEDLAGATAGVGQLHLSGITPALSASARELTVAAATWAHASGVPVSLDVNYRSSLWTEREARAALLPLLPHVTVLFGGPEELRLLAPDGTDARGGADARGSAGNGAALLGALAACGPSEVVEKRGAEGALARHPGGVAARAAERITPVDTVGAGDAFVAGYLSARLDGAGPEAALERGNACGALACLHPGDWEGAPGREELRAFLGAEDPVRR